MSDSRTVFVVMFSILSTASFGCFLWGAWVARRIVRELSATLSKTGYTHLGAAKRPLREFFKPSFTYENRAELVPLGRQLSSLERFAVRCCTRGPSGDLDTEEALLQFGEARPRRAHLVYRPEGIHVFWENPRIRMK